MRRLQWLLILPLALALPVTGHAFWESVGLTVLNSVLQSYLNRKNSSGGGTVPAYDADTGDRDRAVDYHLQDVVGYSSVPGSDKFTLRFNSGTDVQNYYDLRETVTVSTEAQSKSCVVGALPENIRQYLDADGLGLYETDTHIYDLASVMCISATRRGTGFNTVDVYPRFNTNEGGARSGGGNSCSV